MIALAGINFLQDDAHEMERSTGTFSQTSVDSTNHWENQQAKTECSWESGDGKPWKESWPLRRERVRIVKITRELRKCYGKAADAKNHK
jgi:hypothetical protein